MQEQTAWRWMEMFQSRCQGSRKRNSNNTKQKRSIAKQIKIRLNRRRCWMKIVGQFYRFHCRQCFQFECNWWHDTLYISYHSLRSLYFPLAKLMAFLMNKQRKAQKHNGDTKKVGKNAKKKTIKWKYFPGFYGNFISLPAHFRSPKKMMIFLIEINKF